LASDGRWYPPELWTGPPNTQPPGAGTALPQAVATGYPAQGPTPGAAGTVPSGPPVYGATPYPQYGSGPGGPSGQGVAYGQGEPVRPKKKGVPTASLICACAGLFFLPAILGVVFGFIARSQIKGSHGAQRGNGLAIAGIIVGFGWLALVVLGLILGASHHNDNGAVIAVPLTGLLGFSSHFH
jgi:hypothetical protein